MLESSRYGSCRAALAIVIACALAIATVATAAEDAGKPDATVEFTEGSAALGIGYSWGKGVLVYQGKRHPIKISGLSVGELGGKTVSARGEVYHLKKLEDFNGTYTSAGAGATAGGGFDVEAMRNSNGVEIKVVSTTEGADIKAAISGVKFTLE
jgi:hypothetical protein